MSPKGFYDAVLELMEDLNVPVPPTDEFRSCIEAFAHVGLSYQQMLEILDDERVKALPDENADLFENASTAPHRMDAPDGPVCSCGEPSVHESGWCGVCDLKRRN